MSGARQRKDASSPGVVSSSSSTSGSGSTPSSAAEDQLKEQGNRYFASGNYAAAIDSFSRAVELITLNSSPASNPNHTTQLGALYSNRSAAHAALKNYQSALEDADACITVRCNWAKGHFRKGAALEGLCLFQEARSSYQTGLTFEPNDPTLTKSLSDLDALLLELKLTPTANNSSENPDSDRFDLMVRWLKEGGGRFPRLYLQYYSEDYRGVHCLSRIAPDELLLFVPHHMLMTSQVAMDSPIGRKILDAHIELRSKHSYLAAYLLQEKKKGRDSYWEPYINSLPQFYSNMPIFFDETTLAYLKGSFTNEKIKDRIDSLRAEYNNICAHVPEFAEFSHDEFVWARLVVITRIFGLVIRGVKTDGLVAYADMLNHKKPADSFDSDTRWTFDDALNGFTITSLRAINRGEQVYDSYGRKCNSRFFVNYGFALEDNEEDNEAVMKFTLASDHPSLNLKARLVPGRNLLAAREFQVPASYRETSDRERKTKEMFGWIRFCYANDQELMAAGAHEGMKPEEMEPVSSRLEAEVLKVVAAAAQKALDAFETTLEEDNELIETNKFDNSNIRNCVVMRRGEKQVLHWYIRLAEVAIPLLKLNWMELRKHGSKHLTSSARDHYITYVVAQLVKAGK